MTERGTLIDTVDGYRFKQHEMPILPGSPANPDHPPARRAAYLAIGVFMALVGGAQNGFLLANAPFLQAEFALTPVEAGWLTVAQQSARMSGLPFSSERQINHSPFRKVPVVTPPLKKI